MSKKGFLKITKGLVLVPLALILMGNEGCQSEPAVAQRELRRRAQVGKIAAQPLNLNGQPFNFAFVANAQMYTALRESKSFSTSSVSQDAIIDPSQMDQADKDAFYQCEDNNNSQLSAKAARPTFTKESACMIRMPQAVVSGEIENFQLVSTTEGSLNLFFDAISVGLKGKYTKSQLTMSLHAMDPLIQGHAIASVRKKAYQKEKAAGFNLGYSFLGLGFDWYNKTDLSDVVYEALTSGLKDLKTQFDASEEWYAMVSKNCDTALVINAGTESDVGLKNGDLLEVRNQWYDWAGEACNSALRNTAPDISPVALVEIVSAGSTMSFAKVVEYYKNEPILPGARVYMKKMVEPPPAPKSNQKATQQKIAAAK